MVVGYLGFMGVTYKIGQIFLKGEAESALRMWLIGLVGFILIKVAFRIFLNPNLVNGLNFTQSVQNQFLFGII